MKTSKCIYCLKEKPDSEFNKEHVISRFMGRYENSFVLSKHQVCKECNSYFCDNIENEVSFDSYEGLLRIKNSHREIKTERSIGRTRLSIIGRKGIFKGLRIYLSSNSQNAEHIQYEIPPLVGIIKDNAQQEYDYFSIEEIPQCNSEIAERLATAKSPIIKFGYDEQVVNSELKKKGYNIEKAKYSGDLRLSDVSTQNSIEVDIKYKIDELLYRLAAKNLFNFICFECGKEIVLNPNFDIIRDFIRFGEVNAQIKMFIHNGGIKNIPGGTPNCHTVGLAWTGIENTIHLCGFVSWYNKITYIFDLCQAPTEIIKSLPPTKFVICDNTKHQLVTTENFLIIEWPN